MNEFGGCFTFHVWLIYCVIAFIFPNFVKTKKQRNVLQQIGIATAVVTETPSSYNNNDIIKKLCNSDKVDICSVLYTVCTGEIKMAVVFPLCVFLFTLWIRVLPFILSLLVEESKMKNNIFGLKVELCQQFNVFLFAKLFFYAHEHFLSLFLFVLFHTFALELFTHGVRFLSF